MGRLLRRRLMMGMRRRELEFAGDEIEFVRGILGHGGLAIFGRIVEIYM